MGSSRVPRYAPQPLRRSLPVQAAERAPVAMPAAAGAITEPWFAAPKLAELLDPEKNSFGVMRLMMALAVLISHAVFLWSGSNAAEPLVALTGYSLGQYGVQGFFILSGILVTQSLVRRGNLLDYARARALRIFPALIVCVVLTALVVGPALSSFTLAEYFGSSGVIRYIAKTLTLSTGSAELPGLFRFNPAGGLVNQSLWTLKYEVGCYLLLAGLSALVLRTQAPRVVTGVLLALWAVAMLILKPDLGHNGPFVDTFAYFALFFGTGAAAYLLRDWIRAGWQPLPVLAVFFGAAIGTDLAEIASALFLCFALLWLSTFTFGDLRAFTNGNDYSYGTYIYSFPVSQAVLAVWPGVNVVSLIALTLAITLVLAFLSWELIERPALQLVHGWRQGDAPAASTHKNAAMIAADELAIASRMEADTVTPPVVPTDVPRRHSRIPATVLRPWTPKLQTLDQPVRAMVEVPATADAAHEAPPEVIDRSRLNARMAKIAQSSNRCEMARPDVH